MLVERLQKLLLPPGGLETPLDPSEVSLSGRVRSAIDSVTPSDWFGPNQPFAPVAPKDTLPRAFDYPFGSNLYFQPRQEQAGNPSFEQLRQLANYDIVRLCIEARKQQICEMPFLWRIEKEPGEKKREYNERNAEDPRVRYLTEFFKYPDRQHAWQEWLKMLLEEVFVIDALSIWPTRDTNGRVLALNLIDGATIKPLMDTRGWRPNPPNPAYQQIVKGMPALNLTTNDLVYAPFNPAVNRIYGRSHVEQIVMTLLISINRQVSQMAYYTDGNVPEMIIATPPSWTPDQIDKFQAIFDSVAGNQQQKRRVRFVPETSSILQTKEVMLKDERDEWFARICCYCLSVSPQPFVRQMNRATADTAQETAIEEGKLPMLNWLSSRLTFIAQQHMGFKGVEGVFNTEKEADRAKQAEIDESDVKTGIRPINEVRDERGLDPIEGGDKPFIIAGNQPILLTQIADGSYAAASLNRGNNDGSDTGGDDDEEAQEVKKLIRIGRAALKKKAVRY